MLDIKGPQSSVWLNSNIKQVPSIHCQYLFLPRITGLCWSPQLKGGVNPGLVASPSPWIIHRQTTRQVIHHGNTEHSNKTHGCSTASSRSHPGKDFKADGVIKMCSTSSFEEAQKKLAILRTSDTVVGQGNVLQQMKGSYSAQSDPGTPTDYPEKSGQTVVFLGEEKPNFWHRNKVKQLNNAQNHTN